MSKLGLHMGFLKEIYRRKHSTLILPGNYFFECRLRKDGMVHWTIKGKNEKVIDDGMTASPEAAWKEYEITADTLF